MNDRELLELAAKAAGYTVNATLQAKRDAIGSGDVGLWINGVSTCWNPLTDDGDALRLATRLRLAIDHNHPADQQPWIVAERQGCEGCYSPVTCIEDDFDERQRDVATRRAIVRAASEVGMQMQPPKNGD